VSDIIDPAQLPQEDYGLCSCGKPAQRFWNGSPTCWKCWHWWKLGVNEAKFWHLGITTLTHNDFGYGPDPNDLLQWDKWDMRADVIKALETLEKLKAKYVAAAAEYGMDLDEMLRIRQAEDKK
jgi:hypothetical protein